MLVGYPTFWPGPKWVISNPGNRRSEARNRHSEAGNRHFFINPTKVDKEKWKSERRTPSLGKSVDFAQGFRDIGKGSRLVRARSAENRSYTFGCVKKTT